MTKTNPKKFLLVADVHGITATRQYDIKKFGVDLAELPAGVRAIWREAVVPQEELRPTGKFRKQVSDLLFRHAVPTPFGWLVPEPVLPNILGELDRITGEHDAYRDDLIGRWSKVCDRAANAVAQRLGSHPLAADFLKALRAIQPSENELRQKLGVVYRLKSISELSGEGEPAAVASVIAESAEAENESLYQQLLNDTAKVADEILAMLTEADAAKAVNRRTLRKAEDYLVSKVKGLSFVDKRLCALAGGVEQVLRPLADLPTNQIIRVKDVGELICMLTVLANPARLQGRLDAVPEGEVLKVEIAGAQLQLVDDEEDAAPVVAEPSEEAKEEQVQSVEDSAGSEEQSSTSAEDDQQPVTVATPVTQLPNQRPAPAAPLPMVSIGGLRWG